MREKYAGKRTLESISRQKSPPVGQSLEDLKPVRSEGRCGRKKHPVQLPSDRLPGRLPTGPSRQSPGTGGTAGCPHDANLLIFPIAQDILWRSLPPMKLPIPYVVARMLVSSVFVGLGTERLLVKAGILDGRVPPGAAGVALAIFELLAGVAIMAGWQAGRLSLLLGVFLVVDAFVAHPFWAYSGMEQHAQLLHFLKNVAIIGGLLLLSWAENVRPVKHE